MGWLGILRRRSQSSDEPSVPGVRRKPRRLFLWIGAVLLVLDGCVAFVWWYFVQPIRHLGSAEWRETHTDQEVWEEIQRRVHRVGWMHDDFGDVGWRGNKEWVVWLVRRMKPEDDLASCWAGHKDSALEFMTNQYAGQRGKDWLEWWDKNKDKSQEEWIRDGFAARGLILSNPLEANDVWRLLAAIGQEDIERARGYRFNAARLILSSNLLGSLDPNGVPSEIRDRVFLGLRKYHLLCKSVLFAHPMVNHDLGQAPRYQGLDFAISAPHVAYAAYGLMTTVGAGGVVLLALYVTRRRRIHRQAGRFGVENRPDDEGNRRNGEG